ncbi:MAG: endopeptidase [Solirubrobacterales bacterium]|nr:endopeptidase [Solirubrobacterales bacterium]
MRAWKLGATAVAAVIVAEAGVWLLRPREGTVDGPPVPERAYFTEQQIDRGQDFGDGQRLLMFGTLAAEAGLLVMLASGRPAVVRRTLERAGEHPLRGGALVGAGLSLGLAVVALPFGIAGHQRAVDVGLSTQDLGSWFTDLGKSAAIGAVLTAAGAAGLVALMRRFPKRWWIPATGAVLVIEVVFTFLAPVLLAPAFNKFTPLENGKLRSDVLELGREAGVDIGQVYRVDASKRSNALNAYVDGIGSTKRVVLYDTLINSADEAKLRSVVAHELGHVHGNDVPRGLLWVALSAPLAVLFVAGAGEALARRGGAEPGTPASLPAIALMLGVTSFVIGIAGSQLSRDVEARADTFALELTNDPKALIAVQRELTTRNVADPSPPSALQFLFGSHPTAVQRIGAAKAWEEGARP